MNFPSPLVSIIVPALNEAENLPELASRVSAALARTSYEIVIVDDQSKDGTPRVCQELSQKHPLRLLVREKLEGGLSGAVLYGMENSSGEIIVVMDADLQHPPEKIPELLVAIEGQGTQNPPPSPSLREGIIGGAFGPTPRRGCDGSIVSPGFQPRAEGSSGLSNNPAPSGAATPTSPVGPERASASELAERAIGPESRTRGTEWAEGTSRSDSAALGSPPFQWGVPPASNNAPLGAPVRRVKSCRQKSFGDAALVFFKKIFSFKKNAPPSGAATPTSPEGTSRSDSAALGSHGFQSVVPASAEFALGSRYVSGGGTYDRWTLYRRLNSGLATLLALPICGHVRDPMSGFFALRRSTYLRAASLNPLGYKIALELICKCRVRAIREVAIHFDERKRGLSKLTLRQQLMYLAHIDRLYAFSFPLRYALLKLLLLAGIIWAMWGFFPKATAPH